MSKYQIAIKVVDVFVVLVGVLVSAVLATGLLVILKDLVNG